MEYFLVHRLENHLFFGPNGTKQQLTIEMSYLVIEKAEPLMKEKNSFGHILITHGTKGHTLTQGL